MRLLLIDNYDSFTYNLFQLFSTFNIEVFVYRNDEVTVEEISRMKFDWICISPGPKTPKDSGISPEVVRIFYKKVPILGVCLGMQCINELFGGKTIKSFTPCKKSFAFFSCGFSASVIL